MIDKLRNEIATRLDPSLWALDQPGEDGERWVSRGGMSVIWSVATELDGRCWLHVSVARPNRLPSYDDMKRVKHLFVGPGRVAYSVWPPERDHISIHDRCLHLWCPLEGDWPLPDFARGGPSI